MILLIVLATVGVVVVVATLMYALHSYANLDRRMPPDPLAGTRFAKDFRG